MRYQTFFDIVESGYRYWWFPAIFMGFLSLILIEILIRKLVFTSKLGRFKKWSLYFGAACCALWSLQTFIGTFSEYRELKQALQQGKVTTVEGKVENFIPMPHEGHSMESFTVAGHKFEYSDYDVTAGFNQTSSHGGPIRHGAKVRVTFLGNRIARLEVAK